MYVTRPPTQVGGRCYARLESQSADTRTDNSGDNGDGSNGADPPELTQQSSVTEEPPTKAGKRKPTGGENEPDPKRTKSDPVSEASTSKCFDPVLAGCDQDEYHFQPHKVIKEYLEKHFRRSLTKKERKAMLKADPKPECDAATTPEVDEFLQTFWKGHINNTRDNDLKQIQTAVLNATAPLCGLWAQLLNQNLTEDSDLVQAPVVLDMIQRALVFLGNANNLINEKRRASILHSVDPKLTKYAKGDNSNTGKNLFGQSFMKEVVAQVEADTAICKASAIANKANRETQRNAGPGSSKQNFFRGGRTSGYGARSGGKIFNPYNRTSFRGSFRGRQRFQPNNRNQTNVFSRLGPQNNPSADSSYKK